MNCDRKVKISETLLGYTNAKCGTNVIDGGRSELLCQMDWREKLGNRATNSGLTYGVKVWKAEDWIDLNGSS